MLDVTRKIWKTCCSIILLYGLGFQNPVLAIENIDSRVILVDQKRDFSPLKLIKIDEKTQLATRYIAGEGIPIVFVHGSWDDHHSWLPVAETVAKNIKNPIIIYDRRGHSASSPDINQGTISQDVKDAVLLTQALGFKQAHFIGHSYGANIVMQLAEQYPEITQSIVMYEPPLFGLLKGKEKYLGNLKQVQIAMQAAKQQLEQGEIEIGTIEFIENVAFGKQSWNRIFDERARATMLASYRTWLDQANDPERLNILAQPLNEYDGKITIVYGTDSIDAYQNIIQELDEIIEDKTLTKIDGAGHAGIASHVAQTSLAILNHLQNF